MAMLIVSVIVAMVGNLFQQVSDSWTIGMDMAQVNNAGRAALDMIAFDLSQAVAGTIESAAQPPAGRFKFRMSAAGEILFLTFNKDVEEQGALQGVRYYYDATNFIIMKGIRSDQAALYSDENWAQGTSRELIDNALDFRLLAWSGTGSFATWDSEKLPDAVDIYIELLPENMRKRYDAVADKAAFRRKHARRFFTRVYLRNRSGYQPP